MADAPFDTLKNAGFTDEQAEAIVFAIQTSIGGKLATKSDITDFATKTTFAEFRADFYRALWIQGAWLAITFAILMCLMVVLAK